MTMRLKIFLLSMAVLFTMALHINAVESVVLVRASSSAKDPAERNYAASLTRRLGQWLSETGVRTTIVDDEGIASSVNQAKVIILGYNPNPSATELRALQKFINRGGKLIVFYSSSTKLASMMGFKLGKYKSAPLGGKWMEIHFDKKVPLHVPSVVFQNSRNIRVASPVSQSARVVAYWADNNSRLSNDPAWLESRHGFWMTHVLVDDGDTSAKQKMLLGLIAACDSSVWKPAAKQSVKELDYKLAAVVADIRRSLSGAEGVALSGAEGRRIAAIWAEDRKQLDLLMKSGKYAAAVTQADIVFTLAMRAYASLQKPVKGEFRGVWDHGGLGLYPGDWNKTCNILKKAGLTDIFSNVIWAGLAHYPSKTTPQSDMVRLRGDQLQASIDAAHRAGLKLHAWKVCWNLVKASPEFVAKMKKEGRLQISDAGKTKNWLCPSNAKNIKMELAAISEILQNYKVDGIHLDYIRYPDSHHCYCAECRKNFEKYSKQKISNWPAVVRVGTLKNDFLRWRTWQITSFVQSVQRVINKTKPAVKLSVAVYGKYPLCGLSVGQDWGKWLEHDLVDFVCPMDYSNDINKFTRLVKDQVALPHSKNRIYPGIGVTAMESHLDEFEVIKQIKVTRENGAGGFVLFSLNRELEKEILPALRRGITAKR